MIANLKATAWQILAGVYYYSGLPLIRHQGRVAILTYHRVVSDDVAQVEHIQPGMYVRAPSFEAQVAYLRKRFVVLPLEELLPIWRAGRLDRRKAYCVITFDDGWRDNYQYAFPILKAYDLPATIFLATDYIGTSRWFWPDQITFLLGEASRRMAGVEIGKVLGSVLGEVSKVGASFKEKGDMLGTVEEAIDSDALIECCKELSSEVVRECVDRLSYALQESLPSQRVLLSWDEVREMARHGVTFGSHSRTHRIMTAIPPADVEKEVVESWQALLHQGIKPVPVFCYPNGNYNQHVKTIVRDNGYGAAVGCEIGLERERPDDLFALKRISVHEDGASSVPLFALTMSGFR